MTLSKFVDPHKWWLRFSKKDHRSEVGLVKSIGLLFMVHMLLLTGQPVRAMQRQIDDTLTHQRTIKFEFADGLKLKPTQKWLETLTGMITTKDTTIENVFNGEPVSIEKITTITLYNQQKSVVQTITGIDESTWFDDYGKEKINLGKLEDYNHDGYADLWIGFLPYSRLYDNDFVIYLYDPKKGKFGAKKYYLLKNLSEEELKKKLRGDGEN